MSKAIVGLLGSTAAAIGTYGGLVTLSKGGNGSERGDEAATATEHSPTAISSEHGVKNGGPGGNPAGSATTLGSSDSHIGESAKTLDTNKLSPGSVEDFKKSINTNECVKSAFGEEPKIDTTKGQVLGTGVNLGSNEFFSSTSSPNDAKSCLVISWVKTTFGESKWKGKFTWLWTFVKENEGLISFNVAETTQEGKLKVTGVFYLVGKSGDKWEIKYKKEVTDKPKEWGKENLDKFPKMGSAFTKIETTITGDYWGFISTEGDLDQLCKVGDNCISGATEKTNKQFLWSYGAQNKNTTLKSWANSMDWWRNIFGVNDHWKIKTKLPILKGPWTKK